MKRFLQRELETKLGRALIAGDIMDGSAVTLDVKGDSLDFTIHQANHEKAQTAR